MWRRPDMFYLIIRVFKTDSAFVYFILESHEGLCFYSTLPLRGRCRELEIRGSLDVRDDVFHALHSIQKTCSVEIMSYEEEEFSTNSL